MTQPVEPQEELRRLAEAGEYERFLEDAYDHEDFPKPRNILGMAKSLPPGEMEKLMLTNIIVGDGELGELAKQRAESVKGRILAAGRVEPERVFMSKPATLMPQQKEGVKASRVDFILE